MHQLFSKDDTHETQCNVKALFDAMSPEFRHQLMAALVAAPEKLREYLKPGLELSDTELMEASSHLESVITRIELFASDSINPSLTFDEWVKQQEKAYSDSQDVARLEDEGGVVETPNKAGEREELKASYVVWQKDATIKHDLAKEAAKLIKLSQFGALKSELEKMQQALAVQKGKHLS